MDKIMCRGVGYYDNRNNSTPKEIRISRLDGETMSGERLDGRNKYIESTNKKKVKEVKKQHKNILKEENIILKLTKIKRDLLNVIIKTKNIEKLIKEFKTNEEEL